MTRIGKYEIVEEVGQGGMGVVYRGRDTVIGREVALKVILDRALDIPSIKERFYREARAAGALSHENIMTIYDVGEAEGRPYLVMEYLEGTDLRWVLAGSSLPPLDRRLDMAEQIARGLAYAHSRGVIHRDVKPENIRITSRGRLKILDFGIARLESETRTLAQSALGTPRYMSPEQIRGEHVDARSDMFSFGVLFRELLTGSNPFSGDHITTVIYKILNEHPPPPDLVPIVGDTPVVPVLRELLSRCIEKKPNDRFPDMQAVVDELTRARVLLKDHPPAPAPPPAATAPPSDVEAEPPALDETVFDYRFATPPVAEPAAEDDAAPPASPAVPPPTRSAPPAEQTPTPERTPPDTPVPREATPPAAPQPSEPAARRGFPALALAGAAAVAIVALGLWAFLPDDAPDPAPPGAEAPAVPAEVVASFDAEQDRLRLQRDSALAAGAPEAAAGLFEQAEARAEDATVPAGASAEDYETATRAAAEAADLFATARRTATADAAALQEEVADAAAAAGRARSRAAGARRQPEARQLLADADRFLQEAEAAREAARYPDAIAGYAQATQAYEAGRAAAAGAALRATAERQQQAATAARRRVPASGTQTDDFRRAEALVAEADALMSRQSFQRAADGYGQAARLFAAAEAEAKARSQAAAPPTPEPRAVAPATPAPATVAPAEPAPVDAAALRATAADAALKRYTAALARGMEAEDPAALRRVHTFYASWGPLFEIAEDVQASVTYADVDVQPSRTTATVTLALRYTNTTQGRRAEQSTVRYTWTLQPQGDGTEQWSLTGVTAQ